MRIRKQLTWLKKSFTGYEVMFVAPKSSYIVRHRFGRTPEMLIDRHPKQGLQGKQVGTIYFDEYTEKPPPTKDSKEEEL